MSDNVTVYNVKPTFGFYINVNDRENTISVCQDCFGEIDSVVLSVEEALELSRALADIAGARSNG